MFFICISLKSLDLSHLNTSSLIDMSFMFTNCYSLEFLNINFDTSLVTSMECLFFNCSSLTSLSLENFDTSLVQTMREMFLIALR